MKSISIKGSVAMGILCFGCGGAETDNIEKIQMVETPLRCGTNVIDLPGDDSFGEYIEHEDYYLGAMNRELDDDASLREATGLERVETCDEARHFALIASETLATAEERSPAKNEAADDPEESVEKLWRGELIDDRKVLLIQQHGEGWCSSIPFGKRYVAGQWITDILTAAHCVTPGNAMSVDVYRSEGLGNELPLGTFITKITNSPGYTYLLDTEDDIAVLEVKGFNYSNANLNPLYVGNISTSTTNMAALGFGSNSQYSQTGPSLRTGYQYGGFRADWVGDRHFLDENDAEVSQCKGDSGGPARLSTGNQAAVGVASNGGHAPPANICRTDSSDKQRWCKISAHAAWIQQVRGSCGTPVNSSLYCW